MFDAVIESMRVAKELHGESDRGVVLVVAAYVDSQLEELLRAYFIDDKKAVDALLGGHGPLGTFSSRARLAYCLDALRADHYQDIEIIRKIRNEFAHSHQIATFEQQRIQDLCKNLQSHELVGTDEPALAPLLADMEPDSGARQTFIINAMSLFMGLFLRTQMVESGEVHKWTFRERTKQQD